jgi:hypothetical protein
MNITLIVGFLVVINIILLFAVILLIRDIVGIKFLSSQMHNGLGNILNRMQQQDMFLNKLGNGFGQFTAMVENLVDKMNDQLGPRGGMLYRTIDGKYAATSLEDLINKIKDNGEEKSYLSEEEIDGLRKLFEEDDDEEENIL